MIGDFVYYKGYWWQLITQENNYGFGAEPDREQKWKKIDMIKITIDLVHIQLMM